MNRCSTFCASRPDEDQARSVAANPRRPVMVPNEVNLVWQLAGPNKEANGSVQLPSPVGSERLKTASAPRDRRLRRRGLGTPSRHGRWGEMLDPTLEAARCELDLAEAELAVMKQELVLLRLVDTGEPTEEAQAALARLHDKVAQLSASGSPDVKIAGEAA